MRYSNDVTVYDLWLSPSGAVLYSENMLAQQMYQIVCKIFLLLCQWQNAMMSSKGSISDSNYVQYWRLWWPTATQYKWICTNSCYQLTSQRFLPIEFLYENCFGNFKFVLLLDMNRGAQERKIVIRYYIIQTAISVKN